MKVPVVGWAPLRSLEQLGPCGVFLVYQVLQVCEVIRKKQKLSRREAWELRIKAGVAAVAIGFACIMLLAPSGYFGPLSSRVRGLFVQHTRTGNPLVDSVAEHQPASTSAYFQYLHHACTLAPIGFAMIGAANLSDSSSFMLVWGFTSYFFSHKMVRLILLTAPIASVCGGIAAGRIVHWCMFQLWWDDGTDRSDTESSNGPVTQPTTDDGKKDKKSKKAPAKGTKQKKPASQDEFSQLKETILNFYYSDIGVLMRQCAAIFFLVLGYAMASSFARYCWRLSKDLSNPSIIQLARIPDGRTIKVDDYRQAYWWLRDNTEEDARIMAWWDYGYQITAIANRTTIADGNTWNHEHIALLGMALTSPIKEGHEIAKHLADYVLVWAGGGGDDLAKVSCCFSFLVTLISFQLCSHTPSLLLLAITITVRALTWPALRILFTENTVLMIRPAETLDSWYVSWCTCATMNLLFVAYLTCVDTDFLCRASEAIRWSPHQ